MRYSLAQTSGPKYIKTTAVVISELFKIVGTVFACILSPLLAANATRRFTASTGLLAFELRHSSVSVVAYLHDEMVVKWRQAMLLGVPVSLAVDFDDSVCPMRAYTFVLHLVRVPGWTLHGAKQPFIYRTAKLRWRNIPG